MSKIWEWLKEWWYVIFFGLIVVLLIAGTFVWYVFIHEPLTEGFVIGKDYTPAHNVYSPIPMNVNGKTQLIPHWNYCYSDTWCITVQNGDDTDWWYVSESYYDSVKVGDWVTK